MPSRVRFLSSSPIARKDLRGVSDALSKKEYSEKVVWGFIDVRNEGDAVTATFVERFETEEHIEDPFGRSTTYKRTQFNQTAFRLGLARPQLEVYDGPRSIAPLLTELSGAGGSNLAFEQASIDLPDLMKQLKKKTFSFALVATILQDISLTADVFARVAVFGQSEISPHLKVASLGRKIAFEKVSLRGTLKAGAFKIDITCDGRVQIHAGPREELMKMIRASVEQTIGT